MPARLTSVSSSSHHCDRSRQLERWVDDVRNGSLIRFMLVGSVNTVVGLLFIWLAKELAGFRDVAANCTGYAVGLSVSFILNKQWTFRFRGRAGAALLRFLLVFSVAYATNLLTVLTLIKLTPIDSFWCQAVGILPYSSLFYLGCRRYVFPFYRSNMNSITSSAR